jgi:hypothetical protein
MVRVLAGQIGWGNGAQCKHQVKSLDDPTVNPFGMQADAWAGAPYMGGSSVSELKSDIPAVAEACRNNKQWLEPRSIQLICYEGGQHALQNADKVSRDSKIYDVYREYLDTLARYVDGVFCHYTNCGKWSNGGAWGAKEFTGQDQSDAPKYRALNDWSRENPYFRNATSVAPLTAIPTGTTHRRGISFELRVHTLESQLYERTGAEYYSVNGRRFGIRGGSSRIPAADLSPIIIRPPITRQLTGKGDCSRILTTLFTETELMSTDGGALR